MTPDRWKTALLAAAALLAVVWGRSAVSAPADSFSFVLISDVHIPTYLSHGVQGPGKEGA